MYTLTGNYKADQVHAPALIERLGQYGSIAVRHLHRHLRTVRRTRRRIAHPALDARIAAATLTRLNVNGRVKRSS